MAFKVRAENGTTTLFLYDVIHDEIGVSAAEFIEAVESAEGPIELRINSPGGDAWGGKAMADAITRAEVPVTAYGDGLVASAATLPAIAADAFYMRQGAQFVIHKAWTVTVGDDEAHASARKHLQAGNEFLLAAYESKSGQSREQLNDWLAAETWFSADAAIEAGFANEKAAEIGLAALIPSGFKFSNRPDEVTVAANCQDAWFAPAAKISAEQVAPSDDIRQKILTRLAGG